MKTAISIPDSIFQAAEGLATRLGKSRSELFTEAIEEYIKSHKDQNVTEILNEIFESEPSELDEKLHVMQSRSIPKEEW
jgi:metal-responsive CopG/Arc/MetJ family transcriptional regulator